MLTLLALLGVLVMVGALALIPLGVPGTWIMAGVLALGALAGRVGVGVLVAVILLAALAELVEFVAAARVNRRYGGSRAAFWGAVVGGIGGVVIGMPVPLIGPVLAGFVGSFVGAAAVTVYESRDYDSALRVGRGALVGRVVSAAVKTSAGIIILVVGAAALLGG
jgi:uncharacterized protein